MASNTTLSTQKNIFVSIIIPCKNERGNIENAINQIPQLGNKTEIIFIDGNSSDGTVNEINQQTKKHPNLNIRLIHQGDGIGKGDAVRKGFNAAKGDIFIILDADLTVPPRELERFFQAWLHGKGDFINGTRLIYPMEKNAMRPLNLIGNKFFSLVFTWILGYKLSDTLCGTKLISRKHYEYIINNPNSFGSKDPFGDFELILAAATQKLKIYEIPVKYKARTYGKTNISRFRDGYLLLKLSWVAFKKFKLQTL